MANADPYRTLLVHPEADAEIIRVVYRKLAQRYHPDVATDSDAARRMAELNAARDLLLDPVRRAEFDALAAARAAVPAAARASNTTITRPAGPAEPAAGPPPGTPSGSILAFGRYAGWSLGEIARTDIEYIEWLDRMPIGRPFRPEMDALLRQAGRRRSGSGAGGPGFRGR